MPCLPVLYNVGRVFDDLFLGPLFRAVRDPRHLRCVRRERLRVLSIAFRNRERGGVRDPCEFLVELLLFRTRFTCDRLEGDDDGGRSDLLR